VGSKVEKPQAKKSISNKLNFPVKVIPVGSNQPSNHDVHAQKSIPMKAPAEYEPKRPYPPPPPPLFISTEGPVKTQMASQLINRTPTPPSTSSSLKEGFRKFVSITRRFI